MSVSGLTHGKLGFRVIDGRRPNRREEEYEGTRPDALFFRGQTLAIVRHFFEISCQIGRLPSILGREFFRAKVSHHAIPSFEDQVVFVHDVEQALARLNPQDGEVISLVGLYQYSLEEVAAILGRSRSSIGRRFAESVDHLAEMFLASGMLRDDRPDRRLQRFSPKQPRSKKAGLPPKKPVASVGREAFHDVAQVGAKYSFTAHHRVV